MRRFWILLLTEMKAWWHDPISVLGGFIAPMAMLTAFGLLFGGRLGFPIAILNYDRGPWGTVLRETLDEVLSPFGEPYYEVHDLPEGEAWLAYRSNRVDGVWVIPADFSARLQAGENPRIEMHFANYHDDRAKNHRIYSAEILWRFYEKAGLPGPPLALAEQYPRPEMIDWFSLIGVAIVLLATTLGTMFNIFMLTHKERVAHITLEFGLCPQPLAWVLLPKVVLALVIGLLTGTGLLSMLYLWTGVWPGRFLWPTWLLAGLVALFWAAVALLIGLRTRHYLAGAVAALLSSVIVFFISGGLAPIHDYPAGPRQLARLFPNSYAVDPLRDLILFHTWPANWLSTLLILTAFALTGLTVGLALACRQLRHLG